MNPYHKFSETNNWIVNAILEKLLGRMPSRKELQENIRIDFDENEMTNTVYYDERKILESKFEQDGEVIRGYFSVPEQYNDEFIQERVDNWL